MLKKKENKESIHVKNKENANQEANKDEKMSQIQFLACQLFNGQTNELLHVSNINTNSHSKTDLDNTSNTDNNVANVHANTNNGNTSLGGIVPKRRAVRRQPPAPLQQTDSNIIV